MAIGPIGGTAWVKSNGVQYTLRGRLTIQPNAVQNDWIANMDGSQVFTQKPITPYMDMDISDSGGLSLQALAALSGATWTAELINGKLYSLEQAAQWGEITLDAEKGLIKFKCGAASCTELTA